MPERLRVYPLLLTIFVAVTVGFGVTSDGRRRPNHLPLGSDFSQVWVRYALPIRTPTPHGDTVFQSSKNLRGDRA